MPSCLIVDPHGMTGHGLLLQLTELGLEVRTAATLAQAQDGTRYDLVLGAVCLATQQELQVFEAARHSWQAITVAIVQPRNAVGRVLALEFGADAVIEPAVAQRELAARVRSLLRRHRPEAAPASRLPQLVRHGGWHFDRLGRRILLQREREMVRLSDTETLVMAALAGQPGRVMSRAELLASTGLARQGRNLNVIDLAISRLRGKLERAGADAQPLRTVRGLGYAFEPPGACAADSVSE